MADDTRTCAARKERRERLRNRRSSAPVVDMLAPDGSVRRARCQLKAGVYCNGNLAIEAVCPDGEPWGVLTVNPGIALKDDFVCIKDYSEGAGNLRTLEAAGLIETPPVQQIPSGFVQLPVCRLTEKGRAFAATAYGKRDERDAQGADNG